jgi:glycosyltransferase involved in cell wall biosynthesis
MARILRIINRFNLGGPTYNAAYLTKYLNSNYETLLIGGAKDPSEANSDFIVKNLGITPIIIPEMKRPISLKNDWIAYQKLKKIITDYKPDIVHTHASKAGALGRLAAYNQKVPVIIHTFHGHVFDAYFGSAQANFYKFLERRLANFSTKIIAISDIQKDDLVNKFKICNEDKVEIIKLGFDLSKFHDNQEEKRLQFRAKYAVEDDEIAIAITGRLVPVKNHSMFLDVVKKVLDCTTKKVRFFIVGDGEERDNITQKINALHIPYCDALQSIESKPLTLTSWIKDVDVLNAGVDIVVLTSLNEGTPVSLIEAQAANKPIVTTNVGGISDIVIPNKTALLAESNDANFFAEQLLSLIENESKRLEFQIEGWRYVRDRFHHTRLTAEMDSLYSTLLEEYRVKQQKFSNAVSFSTK